MEKSLIFCDLIDRYHYKQLTHDQLVIFRYMLRKCPKLKEEFVFYKTLKGALDPDPRKLRDTLEDAYERIIYKNRKQPKKAREIFPQASHRTACDSLPYSST